MRLECNVPGLEGCWVEISDSWSRRDAGDMWAAKGEDYWAFLRRKTVACHLELTTGQAIDTPDGILSDVMGDADEALLAWIGYVLPAALAKRRVLGEEAGRALQSVSGTVA